MTEKLLPCPFCGGSDLKLFGRSAPEWWVSCQTCRASSQTSSSNDRAASAWNRRIAQPDASVEPVAVVGSVYQLRWLGGEDFPALIMRHELKPGSKLYAAPVAAQPIVPEACDYLLRRWMMLGEATMGSEGTKELARILVSDTQVLLSAAPTPPADEQAQQTLGQIYDLLGVGELAREPHTLLHSLSNVLRRSRCLGVIERHFTVPTPPEPEGDGIPGEECLLRWGADSDEYTEHFQAALAQLASIRNQQDADMVDAQPDWNNRETKTLAGWVNELGTLSQHHESMPGWLRSSLSTIYQGLMAASARPDPEMAGDDLSDETIDVVFRAMLPEFVGWLDYASARKFARSLLKRVQPASVEKAYDKGWRRAATWANRDDIVALIGSEAYVLGRAKAIQQEGE